MIRILVASLCGALAVSAQALNPNSWPTYNGDYSGKRFSSLRQINKSNVGMLTM